MAIADRRERERATRRRLIVTTARKLAEAEGWDAVTTRRLSTEIEYSQPVLYKHFTGMEQIAAAVAIDGFGELADAISAARSGAGTARDALTRIACAYLDFARDNPAVYDVMFIRATTLRFATEDTPPQLAAAFAELRQALGVVAGEHDADTLTELFWAALHGLVTLARAGRHAPATTRTVWNYSSMNSPASAKQRASCRSGVTVAGDRWRRTARHGGVGIAQLFPATRE